MVDNPEEPENIKENILCFISTMLGLATGTQFIYVGFFILYLITQGYESAINNFINGGIVPDELFLIGGLTTVLSLAIGFIIGVKFWRWLFITLRLIKHKC